MGFRVIPPGTWFLKKVLSLRKSLEGHFFEGYYGASISTIRVFPASNWATKTKRPSFPLNLGCLMTGSLCPGLLQSLYNWVVFHALHLWTNTDAQRPRNHPSPRVWDSRESPVGNPDSFPRKLRPFNMAPMELAPRRKILPALGLPVIVIVSPREWWVVGFFHVVLWFHLGLGEPWVFFWNPYPKLTNGTIHQK